MFVWRRYYDAGSCNINLSWDVNKSPTAANITHYDTYNMV